MLQAERVTELVHERAGLLVLIADREPIEVGPPAGTSGAPRPAERHENLAPGMPFAHPDVQSLAAALRFVWWTKIPQRKIALRFGLKFLMLKKLAAVFPAGPSQSTIAFPASAIWLPPPKSPNVPSRRALPPPA